MSNPIIHHPFNFGIGGFNLTGFGIAVLLAFLISQIISERELARRGRDARKYGARSSHSSFRPIPWPRCSPRSC